MNRQPKKRSWWKRRLRTQKLGITVGGIAVLLIVIIVAATSCGTNTVSSSTTASTAVASGSTTTAGSAATTLGSESVTTTVVSATTTTAGAALKLSIVKVTSPVSHGSSATLKAKTVPGAECSIDVEYSSGPSTATGLGSKTADSAGNVSWTWKVGSKTATGTYPITVTASKGGESTTKDTSFAVK